MKVPFINVLLAGLSMALGSTVSLAVQVLPGDTELVPGTTVIASPELGGLVIRDDVSQHYDLDPHPAFAAGHQYQDRVVRSDVTGDVIISPRLRDPFNATAGDILIDGFSLTGYAGWSVDVSYRTDGDGDRGPTFVERSADGDELMFTFGFPLFVGNLLQEVHDESLFVSILTDAPEFATTGSATFFGRSELYPGEVLSFTIDGVAVPSAVRIPSIAPLVLMLAGLASMRLLRGR